MTAKPAADTAAPTAAPIIRDGKIYLAGDDGAIHVGTEGTIAATSFRVVKTPHWQSYGDGAALVRFEGTIAGIGPDVHWLSIDTTESGEKSSKRTMVTLDRPQIERLRDLCNLVLGAQS